ncbi:MAG TPA: PQQ-binding-like beta-propeller repeat protein [Humisphaera sp.]|nr:PQQ-binding-like beta-propeller repeat protein [Humisphaera sp.]
MSRVLWIGCVLIALSAAVGAQGDDWPMWGGSPARNMVSREKNLPASADPGKPASEGGPIDPATTKNVRWVAKIGSAAYGNPVVAGGRVYVGTNNGSPRLAKYQGDYSVLMVFDEKDGHFLWQLTVPKLEAGKVSDWEQVGLCSSPVIEGDRAYVITNRCEVLCLEVHGLQGADKGPFTDEAQYVAGIGKPPIAQGAGDADIIWRYDMYNDLGIFPHNMTSSSPLLIGDKLFITTSNGVDWTNKHTPAPDAPALICLDKNSGKLLAVERSGISQRTYFSNWSSPAYGIIKGQPTVVFGGGDGFCYGFDANSLGPIPTETLAPDAPPAVPGLKELWRCDCNPPSRRSKNGKPIKYGDNNGPSEIIATPVIDGDRVYVGVGQEPESGEGIGALACIEPKGSGDVTQTGKVWTYEKIGRSVSTVSISDGLLYTGEFTGIVTCLDVKTGEPLWTHDAEAHIWGSTLLADGKIYVGNESGILTILAAGREKKVLGTVDFKDPIYSTPVAANGAVYVATGSNLYALESKP